MDNDQSQPQKPRKAEESAIAKAVQTILVNKFNAHVPGTFRYRESVRACKVGDGNGPNNEAGQEDDCDVGCPPPFDAMTRNTILGQQQRNE